MTGDYTRQAVTAMTRAGSADALTAGRPGSWEAALVEQLVKGTVGYGDDEHLPDSDGLHDHARPDPADMRAALGTARAILDGASHGAAHQAAVAGFCPACTAAAGVSFMVSAVSTMAGDTMFVSERTRRVLLAAVQAAEDELREAGN